MSLMADSDDEWRKIRQTELELLATGNIPRRHSIARIPPPCKGVAEDTLTPVEGGKRKAISPQEAMTSEEDFSENKTADQSRKRKKSCDARPTLEDDFHKIIIEQCSVIEEATTRMSGGKLQFTREQQSRVNEAVSTILKSTLKMQAANRTIIRDKNRNEKTGNVAIDQQYIRREEFDRLNGTITRIGESINELKSMATFRNANNSHPHQSRVDDKTMRNPAQPRVERKAEDNLERMPSCMREEKEA